MGDSYRTASAMPLLTHNLEQNAASLRTRPQALVLDWDNEELPQEVLAVKGGFDVIMQVALSVSHEPFGSADDFLRLSQNCRMADVTYNTASFPVLIRTLKNVLALHDSTGQSHKPDPPLILLGYKERDPAERTLWDMARGIGIDFARVGERVGAGGAPVEIWLGVVQKPV